MTKSHDDRKVFVANRSRRTVVAVYVLVVSLTPHFEANDEEQRRVGDLHD